MYALAFISTKIIIAIFLYEALIATLSYHFVYGSTYSRKKIRTWPKMMLSWFALVLQFVVLFFKPIGGLKPVIAILFAYCSGSIVA